MTPTQKMLWQWFFHHAKIELLNCLHKSNHVCLLQKLVLNYSESWLHERNLQKKQPKRKISFRGWALPEKPPSEWNWNPRWLIETFVSKALRPNHWMLHATDHRRPRHPSVIWRKLDCLVTSFPSVGTSVSTGQVPLDAWRQWTMGFSSDVVVFEALYTRCF